ncbi:DUF2285 domain-containing protein [Bradyrhizobium sp. CSA112]|uniref:DUF2285 domain-containing protein n=1 Tax=Bradyrhizobium sp. CSA112 TaxID=2699170 RepID=UPI0023B1CE73|nr:DUF2285 domain-containing protein [Bradyrhizobium sp. CSA112]MDE5456044.1 DUF2285 domain-containing protein [Bradyrhizobium sp. CSA112]
MKTPPLDPHIADVAPAEPTLTRYDEEHIITYMRLLDADQQGIDWRRIDPDTEADRARKVFESHLSRAKWMTEQGYRHLLRSGS